VEEGNGLVVRLGIPSIAGVFGKRQQGERGTGEDGVEKGIALKLEIAAAERAPALEEIAAVPASAAQAGRPENRRVSGSKSRSRSASGSMLQSRASSASLSIVSHWSASPSAKAHGAKPPSRMAMEALRTLRPLVEKWRGMVGGERGIWIGCGRQHRIGAAFREKGSGRIGIRPLVFRTNKGPTRLQGSTARAAVSTSSALVDPFLPLERLAFLQ
jgi:hypothetical protein